MELDTQIDEDLGKLNLAEANMCFRKKKSRLHYCQGILSNPYLACIPWNWVCPHSVTVIIKGSLYLDIFILHILVFQLYTEWGQ